MAALGTSDQNACTNWLCKRIVKLQKPDLAAAVAAADTWFETNAASFNSALPLATRNGLNSAEKWVLAAIVLVRKAVVAVINFVSGANTLDFPS